MKRFLISLLIIAGMFYIMKDRIVIPKEAIRIRVIANSNSDDDQNIKYKVKDAVEDELYYLLKDTKDIDKARELINNDLDNLDKRVNKVLLSNDYTINFGYNYFPEKEYKGIKYDAGMYESVVVTIGEGKGDNWWCVMFPPFCLIEAHDNNTTDIEYRWLVKDLINKYFK
ncbi:MAG: stage II sporulation protein R [Bacilli bacterium]|nr:stage II sporulation protein R [Bacilli bacterium]